MEEPVNSISQDIIAIVLILLCTLGLFRVFRRLKEFALNFSFSLGFRMNGLEDFPRS
jgi:hypothetical protein